jgi:hypothetical protein
MKFGLRNSIPISRNFNILKIVAELGKSLHFKTYILDIF